jgi:Ala-tRNA(Pro) deacylase
MLVERAQRLLETGGVPYEVLPHREAYTAQGVAAVVHVSGWLFAKVVLVRAPGEGPVMAVVPASCRLDLGKVARALGKPSVALVPEAEMETLFPDCETGAEPPFGSLYGVPVWADTCFPEGGDIAFQAGNHHEVVRLRYADWARLARPAVAELCRQ